MFRRSYLLIVLAAAFLAAANVGVFAQTAPVTGTVELEKADKTREPVAGALIEVYRIDIKSGFPSSKTNKKGDFSFAGLALGAKYVFAVSAPNCSPTIFPNVKAGQEKLVITVSAGDGKKLTEAEVRDAVAAGSKNATAPSGEQTAEQKKAQAEFEKKNAEITAKNSKIQNADAVASKSNEEGRAALDAKNYDLAIAKFSAGVDAVPDFVGSTPVMLLGKMIAQKAKGFDLYRSGAAISDLPARKVKYGEANKEYDDALISFAQALDVINKAGAATDAADQKKRDNVKSELYSNATEIHRLKAVGNVDNSKGEDAYKLYTAYIALETDPAKKLATQLNLGDVMRLTGDFDKAIAAYRQVLATKPDQPEALGALGLSLVAQGASVVPEDKEKMQEGLNYMQKYTEIAPVAATDSPAVKELKMSVKETVDYLKSQKLTPQKLPAKKKP